jgi:hypothetical protein
VAQQHRWLEVVVGGGIIISAFFKSLPNPGALRHRGFRYHASGLAQGAMAHAPVVKYTGFGSNEMAEHGDVTGFIPPTAIGCIKGTCQRCGSGLCGWLGLRDAV